MRQPARLSGTRRYLPIAPSAQVTSLYADVNERLTPVPVRESRTAIRIMGTWCRWKQRRESDCNPAHGLRREHRGKRRLRQRSRPVIHHGDVGKRTKSAG